jgi:RNA recognition motif-containing protein
MKLHIGNLSKQVTDAQFTDMVSPFGPTSSVEIARDRAGESKGFAFAEYGDAEHAKAAMSALDGKEVDGVAIKVSEARPRPNAAPRT